jgi:hypothetical protein
MADFVTLEAIRCVAAHLRREQGAKLAGFRAKACQNRIFQGKTFLPRRGLEWAMLSNFPVSLDKDAGPQRRTKSGLQPFS